MYINNITIIIFYIINIINFVKKILIYLETKASILKVNKLLKNRTNKRRKKLLYDYDECNNNLFKYFLFIVCIVISLSSILKGLVIINEEVIVFFSITFLFYVTFFFFYEKKEKKNKNYTLFFYKFYKNLEKKIIFILFLCNFYIKLNTKLFLITEIYLDTLIFFFLKFIKNYCDFNFNKIENYYNLLINSILKLNIIKFIIIFNKFYKIIYYSKNKKIFEEICNLINFRKKKNIYVISKNIDDFVIF